MKKSIIAAAFGGVLASGLLVVPAPAAHADSGYTITLNGQNIAQGSFVLCSQGSRLTIHAGPDPGSVGGSGVAEVAPDGTQVISVDIAQNVNGKTTDWGVQRSGATPNATVTKSGNTYKIAGTATQTVNPGSSPVPFEFDATCTPPQ